MGSSRRTSRSYQARRDDLTNRVRVYIDTNVIVYAMETDYDQGLRARRVMRQIERKDIEAVTSEITLAEALRGGNARSSPHTFRAYVELLSPGSELTIIPVIRDILISAAGLATDRKIDLPDAIHVATALHARCDVFLTDDRRLTVPAGLQKSSLADWIQDL
jgi:predicted nucleic acid-binding protein